MCFDAFQMKSSRVPGSRTERLMYVRCLVLLFRSIVLWG